jgi:hypothetical protein
VRCDAGRRRGLPSARQHGQDHIATGEARFQRFGAGVLKDIDKFVFADTPVDEELVRELASGGFLDAKRNAIFIGGTEPAS